MHGSSLLIAALAAAFVLPVWADPPADPAARKLYDHNKEWLAKFPSAFVAANIRGQGMQYAERRQAALDLVRQQRDFSVVSELIQALEEKSFLSDQIIDLLADWKAKRALFTLETIKNDAGRDKVLRDKAAQAYDTIKKAKVEAPPKF